MKSAAPIVAIVLSIGLLACSRPAAPSIHGRWVAEDEAIGSLVFPGGPELDISAGQVFIPGAALAIPVAAEEPSDGAVTLKTSVGLGWTFFFDAADRMYVEVPFAGRVYYRRVAASATLVPAAGRAPSAATVRPVAAPAVDVLQPVADAAQAGNTDAALRALDAALRSGRTQHRLVEADPRLASLREDVRYRVLLARSR